MSGLTGLRGLRPLTSRKAPRGGAAAAATVEWPAWSATVVEDFTVFGTSTQDASGTTPPTTHIKNDYAPTATITGYYPGTTPDPSGAQAVMRWAQGGKTENQVRAFAQGAPPRVKAAFSFIELCGSFVGGADPVPNVIAQMDLIIGTDLGHSNFCIINKHHDGISNVGGYDHFLIEDVNRQLAAPNKYFGKVTDFSLYVRHSYSARDGADTTAMSKDMVPVSLQAPDAAPHTDTAHMNGVDATVGWTSGNHLLARDVMAPALITRISGKPACIPHQTRFSIATSNQTASGDVCELGYSGSLSGCAVDIFPANAQFEVEIRNTGGADHLWLKRSAGATYQSAGYHILRVRARNILTGQTNWGIVKVYLIDIAPDGSKGVTLNSQWWVRAGPIGGVTTSQKYSFAVCMRALSAHSTSRQILFRGDAGAGQPQVNVGLKNSANQNVGTILKDNTGTTVVNFDQPTAQGFTAARGLQWFFGAFDASTGGAATGGGTAKVRTDSLVSGLSAVSTTGTCTLGATFNLVPAIASKPHLGFSSTIAGASLWEDDFVCLVEWADYFDWGNTANLDLVRDPTTRRPVIGQTRGADTIGKVNGVAAFNLKMGGPPNIASGINLMDYDVPNGRGFFDCTDIASLGTSMTEVSV